MTRAWTLATARRLWAGLTVCVYLDVHASGSRSLPYAATLSSIPTDDACSSSSLSTTVINFLYFRTPLANFLLSRLNSVEYGNSKTTTLLPSAKCTGIVTCQRLVTMEGE